MSEKKLLAPWRFAIKKPGLARLVIKTVFCDAIAQALEGLVVSAADMAEASSTQPATARKPMVQR